MEAHIVVVVLSAFVFSGIFLLYRFPRLRACLPEIRRFVEAAKLTIYYWRLKRVYSDTADNLLRYLVLVEEFSFDLDGLRASRESVGKYVADMYKASYPKGLSHEAARRLATASYVAMLEHEEIMDSIRGLKDHPNLDVRKATLVIVDVLGEVFDRKDELSREYFQHVVYGLNQCLIKFKKGGNSDSTMRDVFGILWRLYALTKAYYSSTKNDLTKEEFYEKVRWLISTMLSVIGED